VAGKLGQLERVHPNLRVQLLGMTTQADRLPYVSLYEIGGKGLFVKELEEALLDGRADIAVHSMKDVPVELPPGLTIPVMCTRETPWDAFVSTRFSTLEALPLGAVVGTSSLRRISQLLRIRPDLQLKKLRGNINTRLKKLDAGEYDAIIIAAAGLLRLGFTDRIAQMLPKNQFLPAAGQGVLGIECIAKDQELIHLVMALQNSRTFACVSAERAMCKQLNAGCQTPVAGYAELEGSQLTLTGFVATLDGQTVLSAKHSADVSEVDVLGLSVANDLLAQGAAEILAQARHVSGFNEL
jgi:hydroxymethylbilane synthase